MQDLPATGFVGGKPNIPVKEGVAEDIEEAVRRARSDVEARLIFQRPQMERAVDEGPEEGPIHHCPCCVQ
eukprot:1291215-Lingulodinium_polyedra.AAC.1